jgi:hypothetical protein
MPYYIDHPITHKKVQVIYSFDDPIDNVSFYKLRPQYHPKGGTTHRSILREGNQYFESTKFVPSKASSNWSKLAAGILGSL